RARGCARAREHPAGPAGPGRARHHAPGRKQRRAVEGHPAARVSGAREGAPRPGYVRRADRGHGGEARRGRPRRYDALHSRVEAVVKVTVPGDKSLTRRALILASLAEGESRLSGLLYGGDAASTAAALR